MPALKLELLSPFARLAVELDTHFTSLEQIGGQLQRLEIDSDSALEHAVKLLKKFAEQGQHVAGQINAFSSALQVTRERAEAAARIVAEQAPLIEERRKRQNQLHEALGAAEQKVKTAYAGPASLQKKAGQKFSESEKEEVTTALSELGKHLPGLIEEVQAIKAQASEMNFKGIQRQAQNLLDALKPSQKKISHISQAS